MMIKRRGHTAGFSLLEMILSVGVVFALMIAVFLLLQTFGEREMARSNAKYMNTIAESMNLILQDLDNFNALYQAAADPAVGNGGYELIADQTAPATNNITKNFVVNGVTIQGSRLFNPQFRDYAPIRANVRILLRVADDRADPNDDPALDVMIITTTPRPDSQVRTAATEAGPHGGFIRSYGAKTDARIESAFGSWQVNPSDGLQNTAWYINNLNPDLDSLEDGSYFVYYMYKNIEEVGGDYLHRLPDVDPALRRNTMFGPLNLGGNDIFGGDDINIGNDGSARALTAASNPGLHADCENNVLCVSGTAIVKGSATVSNTMSVNGSALIADTSRTNNLRIENALTDTEKQDYNAQNHLIVDGDGNDGMGTQDLVEVTNNARFLDGSTVATGNLTNTNNTVLTMPDGGVLTAGTVDAHRLSATSVASQSLLVDNQLRSGIVTQGNINVANGKAGVIDIRNSGDLVFGGTGPGRERTITAPRVNIRTLNISNFGQCFDGCAGP